MRRRILAAATALVVVAAPAAAQAAKDSYRAEIRRTTGGWSPTSRPPTTARWATATATPYAQDQICELADIVVTVNAAALALLRSRTRRQPRVGLLLPAHQGRAHRREARRPQGAQGPSKHRAPDGQGLRGGRQRLPAQAQHDLGPDVPRQDVGAPDPPARPLPPLLPARPAGQLGQLPRRDRGRRAAVRPAPHAERCQRSSRERLATTVLGADTLGSNAYGIGSRRRPRRPLARARQPALPVARLRALLRAAPDRSRASSTRSAPRCRACRRSTSASTATSRAATPSRPPGGSRRTSSTCARPADQEYLVDGKAIKMRQRTVKVRVRGGGTGATRSTRPAGGRCFSFPAAGLTWTTDRRTRSPTSTRTTSGSSTSGPSTTRPSPSRDLARASAASRATRGST